jgi:cobalt-zinc-cadmium efflux system membrane fusion protein
MRRALTPLGTVASLLTLAVLALGCSKAGERGAAPARVEKDAVIFETTSPQLAALQTASVEPRREALLRFPGRLVWNEDRTVRVFAPFPGRVMAITAKAGDRVGAGQTLAKLAAPELGVAQSDARKAEQDYGLAQKNLARVEELHAAGVAPTKDLQAAQADFARTSAERSRTQARLKLYGTDGTVDQQYSLRSAIAGVVVERNINPGQEIRPDANPDKPLFVISDPSRLWFLLDVAEKDVGELKAGVQVKLGTSSLGEERVVGRIVNIADLVDPQTRTVKVRGTVDAAEPRLKAEMFVTAELKVPAAKGLTVPARAVYLRGEQYYVFVEDGPARFVRRAVQLGPGGDGQQVVLAGLEPTQKVVVDGNLLLEKILASKD